MNSNKVTTYFIPLAHNTEFTVTTNPIYGSMRRLDSFLVKNTLSGNVTITTWNNGEAGGSDLGNANVFSEFTLPATALTQGEIYTVGIKKVSYENASDQANPPLIGLI